ncbi:phospho-sugar mutase [Aquipuribacter nitratireducens]|uniref:Phospho-sugar mutase n=1 Tax=Aquipuribacter nitratireducens TaxID=650104 RepID=A0ABW0GNX7_9MICO
MSDAAALLRAEALAWADGDVDPADATALRDLVAAADAGDAAAAEELRDSVGASLTFGTAGLRGRMGPGPNRMNRAVVVRAAAGLATWLRAQSALAGETPRVVVGHDARHGSQQFARDTAAVLTAAGCDATLVDRPVPTPVVAHAVRRLDADAGVVVTASHNPKDDNGYKVYLGGRVSPDPGAGVQIVPPADAGIAAAIDAAPPSVAVPRAGSGWAGTGEDLLDAYAGTVAALAVPGPRDLRVVTTAMHGVGDALLRDVLGRAGFTDVTPVPEQAAADPDFPTVPFPNPEEAGALDLALALAAGSGADLVIANDPDADRCSVAVPDPSRGPRDDPAGWRQLSGDEVGALLAEHVLTRGGDAPPPVDDGEPATLAASLVSSALLHRVAAAHGTRSATTLTGFKWIARVPGLVYGYEEALGYCVAPGVVRDKDGVSAALLVAELAARAAADGRGLLDLLDDLHRAHGAHLTAPVTLRLADMSVVPSVLSGLLRTPPADLAGLGPVSVEDLSAGVDGLPPTSGVRLAAAADGGPDDGTSARVVVRPSGTEPKLKAYCEVVQPVVGTDLAAARAAGAGRLDALQQQVRELLTS